ncbi:hypothetical protein A0H76_2904 [Hepatospora eriocheir]|uniref:Uncharacterized protein n=1 Tax=Hepatospora eriocheir TaxID=1081669 RepID=A0A1X0Q5K8_9MICR|nr:hypothetical protein A0H76_2904 [Hepatospora eriocheir]
MLNYLISKICSKNKILIYIFLIGFKILGLIFFLYEIYRRLYKKINIFKTERRLLKKVCKV